MYAAAIASADYVISGQISCGSQYHFHLENQVCLCTPVEDGFALHCSTQWTGQVQAAVAGVLGIPISRLDEGIVLSRRHDVRHRQ